MSRTSSLFLASRRSNRRASRLAAIGLLVASSGLAGCQTALRAPRPEPIPNLRLVGVDSWETQLVSRVVTFDPSRPVRVGDLGIAGSVRITGVQTFDGAVTPDPPAVSLPNGVPVTDRDSWRLRPRMRITAAIRVTAPTAAEAARRARNATVALVSEPDAQVLRLVAPGSVGWLDRVNYDVMIDVPASLTVQTLEGDVVATRLTGHLEVLTVAGDVDIEHHGRPGEDGIVVRATSREGDVRVDAQATVVQAFAEQGKVTVDWAGGRQPAVLDVVSRTVPQLPATLSVTPNVRVSVLNENERLQWQDRETAVGLVEAPGE